MTTRILVVDNYDSFVWTIAGYLAQLGAECDVLRNDVVSPGEAAPYDGVLISPGPGTPSGAGVSNDMVRFCADEAKPLLGVCLGHQALGEVFGGRVTHAPELMHGKTSLVHHDGEGVLEGLPSPFTATRYHSLAVVPETRARGAARDRAHRERRRHGRRAPRAAAVRRAVPPRVRAHRGRPPPAGQLARGLRGRRGGGPFRRDGPARAALKPLSGTASTTTTTEPRPGSVDQVEPGAVESLGAGVLAVGEDVGGGVVVGLALGDGPLDTVRVTVLFTGTGPGCCD